MILLQNSFCGEKEISVEADNKKAHSLLTNAPERVKMECVL